MRRVFDDRTHALDRFGALLLVTCAGILVLGLFDLRGDAGDATADLLAALTTVLVGGTFVLALRASGVARRWRIVTGALVAGVVVLTLVLVLVGAVTDVDTVVVRSGSPSPVWVLVSVLTPVAVVRRLTQHRRVTLQTLFGVVSAYLLLALAFDLVFLSLDAYGSQPFFGQEEPTTAFMYFSLVTITTLGYGDLSAVTDVGRMAAVAEAVIGQVFLVVVVAAFVGMFIQDRDRSDRLAGSPAGGGADADGARGAEGPAGEGPAPDGPADRPAGGGDGG